jgi:hypothetical protein
VIFDVADDLGHIFDGFGHLLLPRIGIGNHVGDVALVVAGGEDRSRGVEVHITGGADSIIRAQNGLERSCAAGRGDDGLVNAVGGVMSELDQQQQLREGVVLKRDAFGEPALGNAEQFREEPGLVVAVVIAEVFSSVSLANRKATSLGRRRLRSSRVWMLDSPTMGAFSVLVGMLAVESVSLDSSVKVAVSPSSATS